MSDQFEGLSAVKWPVLIKYSDYEELGLITDLSGWETEVGVGATHLSTAEILIDASGASFSLLEQDDGAKALVPTQSAVEMDQLLIWIRAHASLQGHCCVSKLYASSIDEVFAILKSLDD